MKTITLQGKEYAQVVERLKEFRKDNPRGKIETTPHIQEDGKVLFKAYILKDKSDENSAEATGHALGENKGIKAFEKLETIAVGRALALLGYASDGEIASGEEMEEYLKFQEEKKSNLLGEAQVKLENTKTLQELSAVWASTPGTLKPLLAELKDNLKKQYESTKVSNTGGVDGSTKVQDNGIKA